MKQDNLTPKQEALLSQMERYEHLTAAVPHLTVKGIKDYVVKRTPPGSFLMAVLSNDLKGAVNRADIRNRDALFDIVAYLWNAVPSACWGSEEAVKDWLEHKEE